MVKSREQRRQPGRWWKEPGWSARPWAWVVGGLKRARCWWNRGKRARKKSLDSTYSYVHSMYNIYIGIVGIFFVEFWTRICVARFFQLTNNPFIFSHVNQYPSKKLGNPSEKWGKLNTPWISLAVILTLPRGRVFMIWFSKFRTPARKSLPERCFFSTHATKEAISYLNSTTNKRRTTNPTAKHQ